MPSDKYFDQQKRVAAARGALADAMLKSDERDISIWIAALTESLKRMSDNNLEAELDEPKKGKR